MATEIGGDHPNSRQMPVGEVPPPPAVPGEAVQGQHGSPVLGTETMDLQVGHAVIVADGTVIARFRP